MLPAKGAYRMKSLILLAALAAPLPLAAQSISAAQPDSVSSALQALDLPVQSGSTPEGLPALVSQLDGATFTILFYSCDDPRGCQDLQFRAIFAPETPATLEKLNAWNQSAFVGKAFTSGDTVVLEHPIAAADGMSRYSFNRTMALWRLAMAQFRETLTAE
jgi:hypothetical protein